MEPTTIVIYQSVLGFLASALIIKWYVLPRLSRRTLLGEISGATLVKLRRDKPKISYLCYPDFDQDPHPKLRETFVADLRTLRMRHRD